MDKNIFALVCLSFLFQVTFVNTQDLSQNDRCSTLSCVHASATILRKINLEANPCDDFYEFACGTFMKDQHTPDESSTINTLALMQDKLYEFLLTLVIKPIEEDEKKLHALVKKFYKSCMDESKLTFFKRQQESSFDIKK